MASKWFAPKSTVPFTPPPAAYTPTRADASAITAQLNEPVTGFSAITNNTVGSLKMRDKTATATTGGV